LGNFGIGKLGNWEIGGGRSGGLGNFGIGKLGNLREEGGEIGIPPRREGNWEIGGREE